MSTADPSDRPETVRSAHGRNFRIRVLLGGLLLLLVLNGVGISVLLKAFESPRRLRVGLANYSGWPIRGAQVEHDGRVVFLDSADPIGRISRAESWVETKGLRKVRITFDVTRGDGQPIDRVESEVSWPWELGDSIDFEYHGTSMTPMLNNKLDISIASSFKILPGKRP